jgi:hypothetical protein
MKSAFAARRIAFAALAASVLLAGCGLLDSDVRWQDDRFVVLWIDMPSQAHLAYRMQGGGSTHVVEACVFAVASDARYITLKRAAAGEPAGSSYFVVDKAAYSPDAGSHAGVQGPLTKPAFDALQQRRALPTPRDVMPARMCRPA